MGGPGSGPTAAPVVTLDEEGIEPEEMGFPPVLLDNPEDLPKDLENIPREAQMMLVLQGFGYTHSEIAARCKCARETVCRTIKRHDPRGVFRITPALRETIAMSRWALAEQRLMDIAADRFDELTPMQAITGAAIARDKQLDTAKQKSQFAPGTPPPRLAPSGAITALTA